jgi:hypothetical protein
VDIRDWTTGTPGDFRFANPTNAKKIDPKADLGDVDELPRWMKGTNE